MNLLAEFKRRNVFRVGVAYAIVAWLVIQVVETIFPAFGIGDEAIRLTTLLLAIGLLPALVFAWMFELTPQGLQWEKQVDREQSITAYTGRKLDRVIIVMLSLALAYFIVDKYYSSTQSANLSASNTPRLESDSGGVKDESGLAADSQEKPSIAVLPFANMSSDPEQEYFSDGISEELLNLLARIPKLRVISRSSAFHFKNRDMSPRAIAEALEVDHILDGSVRKSGDQIRITAQLIEVDSDTPLWSQSYDRTLQDIFITQENIATAVVEQLQLSLLGDELETSKVDAEAFTLFLQARHMSRLGSADGYHRSNELLHQALEISPDYSAAWDALATNYINLTFSQLLDVENGYSLARQSAQQALKIDPQNAMALGRLGLIAMIYDSDPVAAAAYMEKALKLQPESLNIIGNASLFLLNINRLDSAIALAEYAAKRDPMNSAANYNLGSFYYYAGRWDDAITAFKTTLRLSPDFIGAHYGLAVSLLMKGEIQSALAEIKAELSPAYRLTGLALSHYAAGDIHRADQALEEVIANHAEVAAYSIASVYAYRKDADNAFKWLEQAIDNEDIGLSDIVVEQLFSSLHDDPRWDKLLESLGKSPEQLDKIDFEVNLP